MYGTFSYAPSGACCSIAALTHALRRGRHSFAASRLLSVMATALCRGVACLSEHTMSLCAASRPWVVATSPLSIENFATSPAILRWTWHLPTSAANIPILFRDADERGDGHHKAQIVVSNQESRLVRN